MQETSQPPLIVGILKWTIRLQQNLSTVDTVGASCLPFIERILLTQR